MATKINQPISVINLCDLRSATWVHSLRPMCSMTGWVLPPMICLANLNLWKQSIQTQSREHAIDWPPVLSQGSWTLSSFSSICHYDQIIQFRAFSMLARQSVRNFLLPNPVRFRDCEVRSWESLPNNRPKKKIRYRPINRPSLWTVLMNALRPVIIYF